MMDKQTTRAILKTLALTSVLVSSPAWSLRCGNAIIVKGDTQAKVVRYCGEPVSVTSRYEFRPGVYRDRNSGVTVNGDSSARTGRFIPFGNSDVLVEDWTYNFGPNKLMRLIRFADGFVEDVRELGYGYR